MEQTYYVNLKMHSRDWIAQGSGEYSVYEQSPDLNP